LRLLGVRRLGLTKPVEIWQITTFRSHLLVSHVKANFGTDRFGGARDGICQKKRRIAAAVVSTAKISMNEDAEEVRLAGSSRGTSAPPALPMVILRLYLMAPRHALGKAFDAISRHNNLV
jgi:hypothetical protein